MPAMPEGWELDYDGSRWVYRFAASGLTQYQFPKPGDEFPEFVSAGGLFDMAPEDCLASERQVKRQSMDEVGTDRTKPSALQRRKMPLEDVKEVEATEYFDTEKFMYLGPVSFFGSGTFGDQQTRIKLEAKRSDTERQPTPSSIIQCGEEAKEALGDRPVVDKGANDDIGTAQWAPPQSTENASKGAKAREADATTAHSIQEKLRVQSPVGFVAELACHETRKWENHMSNIEPDRSDRSTAAGLDAHFNDLFELPADGKPINTKKPQPQEAKAASARPVDFYPLVSASFAFPPLRPKQPTGPPKTAQFPGSAVPPRKPPSQAMARPLSYYEGSMSRGNNPGDKANRSETRFASMPEIPTLPTLTGVQPRASKRYSIQGPGPAATLPSRHPEMPKPPSGFQSLDSSAVVGMQNSPKTYPAPRLPPKIPLSPVDTSADSSIHNTTSTLASAARHENVFSDTSRAPTSSLRPSGLAQCPSVLRPGYHRTSATGPPQQDQSPSVLATPDRQRPHQQHLPHTLPVRHSHSASEPVALQTRTRPQWHGGHVFDEPAVRMPDERDFAVRPTATTRSASEPAVVLSPTTVSSPKSPSGRPGFFVFREISPVGPQRKPMPVPIASRTGASRMKAIHELGGDTAVPIELPSYEGTKPMPYQPPPFVAPLRLSPSVSRRQGELPPPMASATHELATMSLVPQEYSRAKPHPGDSAQRYSDAHYRMSGSTAGADSPRQHVPEAVETMPLKSTAHLVHSRPIDGASSAIPPWPPTSETVPRHGKQADITARPAYGCYPAGSWKGEGGNGAWST